MNKFEVTKNIMENIEKEFGEIDITQISHKDLEDTVRVLKYVKELDNQYAEKCNMLEGECTPKQQDVFYKFEWLFESFSPEQIRLLHEIEELKEKMLALKISKVREYINN